MQIPTHIAFHGVDKSVAIEERIHEKVGKLERYFDRITACRVTVERHHGSNTRVEQPFHISIVVDVPGQELVVKRDPKDRSALKDHQDIQLALRDAFSTMERQLKDYVNRRWRDVRAVPEPSQVAQEG